MGGIIVRHRINEKFGYRVFIISCALSMVTILYVMLNITYFRTGSSAVTLVAALMGISLCLLVFFIGILVHIHRLERCQQLEQKIKEAQQEYVEKLLSLVDEQRNDILNAISVVTAYLQIGEFRRAQRYLEFIAADQLDKFDYHSKTWLSDPWEATLKQKQKEALVHGILFTVEEKLRPPEDERERRLVARLMANLIEDAFQGVLDVQDRHVWLRWHLEDGKAVLEVKNNQPGQASHFSEQGAEMEPAGRYLEDDIPEKYIWRLPICRQIAAEAGGILTVTNSGQTTTYRFVLQ